MMRQRIEIARPLLGQEEWEALRAPLEDGWISQGPRVAAFEQAFARRHKVEYARATNSCTTALHLALLALGIGPGDKVIVPAFTWVATANAVRYAGAEPVFVDVNPVDFNLDTEALTTFRSRPPKALIAVHLFGLCADMDRIRDIFPEVPIIEDAACAVGAAYKGKAAGSLGELGCFSFHPRKIITTGEGGMITTRNRDWAERIERLRNHGASQSERERHYGPRPYLLPDFEELGFNYRMTDLQGAVGAVQLTRLDAWLEERRQWSHYYREALREIPWVQVPEPPEGYDHSWQSFVLRIKEESAPLTRNQIMDRLMEKGISTRPGTHAVPFLGAYAYLGHKPKDFPGAWVSQEQSLAIPLHQQMVADDYEYIVSTFKDIACAP